MTSPPESVTAIVDTVLDARIEHCRVPSAGAVADTFVLTLDRPPHKVVCKRGGTNIWTGDVVEPHVIEFVNKHTELPVPELIESGSLGKDAQPKRWALYSHIEGKVPDTGTQYSQLLEQAGAILGRLHTATDFDRSGGLKREGADLRVTKRTSTNLLASPVARLLGIPQENGETLSTVLTHGDFHPGNLLVDDGTMTAVLDWGNAHITVPGYALARAEARFVDLPTVSTATEWSRKARERHRTHFREGYRQHAALPPEYQKRAPRYRLLWTLQSGINLTRVASHPRGRTQLQRQCRNWLERRLD